MNNNIFDLKRSLHINNDIKKEDYLKLRPTTSSADNKNQSGEILFQIAQASSCLDICDSLIYFYIEINDLNSADDRVSTAHSAISQRTIFISDAPLGLDLRTSELFRKEAGQVRLSSQILHRSGCKAAGAPSLSRSLR